MEGPAGAVVEGEEAEGSVDVVVDFFSRLSLAMRSSIAFGVAPVLFWLAGW